MAIDLPERKIRDHIFSRGKVTCTLDVSTVVGLPAGVPSFSSLLDGIRKIRAVAKSLVLSVEVIHLYPRAPNVSHSFELRQYQSLEENH
jgi:hypothetical protein